MRIFLALFISLFLFISAFAKEGMWVPTLLKKYPIEDMQKMGFRLTTEDVYSINQSSLKDAVVIFGKGCTGEIISDQGLLLTNHHCGFSDIQSHSSLNHDYLTDGFWAMSKEEELSNPGLTAKFLDRMVDVTDSIFYGTDTLSKQEQQQRIEENISNIQETASDSGKYEAIVKPLFNGNQYFLYVYKVYRDVRLVGTPPMSIGKFGGDNDNWMWPRHTGDFSIFRVYANKNNEPADYSPDNVPYHPKSFLQVSLKGIQPDDFIMVMGYPGTTREYLPSQAVDLLMNVSDPDKIKIRTATLNVLSQHMKADPKVRIQYADKYDKTSNYWKKWKGEINGLRRLNAIQYKKDFESEFESWYSKNDSLRAIYGSIFSQFEKLYIDLTPFEKASNYYDEIVFRGIDIFTLASYLPTSERGWDQLSEEQKQIYREYLLKEVKAYFKDYDESTDKAVFLTLLHLMKDDLDPSFLPEDFQAVFEKYDDEKLIRKVYERSILSDREALLNSIDKMDGKWIVKLQKDPVFGLYRSLRGYFFRNVSSVYQGIQDEIKTVQKRYMQGIMSMSQLDPLYPDANFTMRVAYGKVEGYQPRDAVNYTYYTTLKGVMEKDNPAVYASNVPPKLRDLYQSKDFGSYGEDGHMPVAFIASVHTTGGNSGSPALNADGQLIGLNFDRNWEGTMSDIIYDPAQCRNIMLDIRYVLFIIDKFAGAGYLLDEMKIAD